ncbi:MAG: ABC transporter ATP-binding protein [Pseudomonadota bacterium]
MLEIDNIEVNYHRTVQVLRGLSLIVPEGQIVALLGANGAGKTTTLKAASNLLALENGAIDGGRIVFDGRDTLRVEPDALVRQGLFHVREGRRIFTEMTVEDNLIAASYALEGRGLVPDYDKIYSVFPRLAERRRQLAGFLSGGEQQMLAFGRAMVARPRMILMDEPSLGLAPKVVEEIFDIIRRFNREEGITILLVEQNAAVAFSVAHRAYVMEHGQIVMEGDVETLRNDPDIQSFYLGIGEEGTSSFRDVKHYKRRKRWLS